MHLSQKSIDEFKEIYKKEHGTEMSDAEASESAHNLLGLFEIFWESALRDQKRNRQLKKEPQGFHITDGTYSCMVCGNAVTGEQSWYDKWGVKCLLCQKAVTEGVIPGFICIARDSCYRLWELKSKFNIHSATVKKLIREGKLKARIVTTEAGSPHEYIFLKKENPEFISRNSPERKSYDRHRDKENERQAREWKQKMKAELKQTKATRKKRD